MRVPLTQGYFAIIDDDDYPKISGRSWQYAGGYAVSGSNNPKNHVRMHRIIMGARRDEYIDHINGDRLDNRKCNLRFATNQLNQANRGAPRTNTSGYKGVTWHKLKKLWMASINTIINGNRKTVFIGYFRDKAEAAKAYNKKAKEIWGSYAKLNEV